MLDLEQFPILPKLISFDLDYTLWPFWCDTHVDLPLSFRNGFVYGSNGFKVVPYRDSDGILKGLQKQSDLKVACVSRTGAISVVENLLDLLGWTNLFHYREIFPGCKVQHFQKLHRASGVSFADMIFFDDEHRNIYDVGALGVHCRHVSDGLTVKLFYDTIHNFVHKKQKNA